MSNIDSYFVIRLFIPLSSYFKKNTSFNLKATVWKLTTFQCSGSLRNTSGIKFSASLPTAIHVNPKKGARGLEAGFEDNSNTRAAVEQISLLTQSGSSETTERMARLSLQHA